jgi:ribosomal protein L31E
MWLKKFLSLRTKKKLSLSIDQILNINTNKNGSHKIKTKLRCMLQNESKFNNNMNHLIKKESAVVG